MRLAVICDYLEENWPSMDLVADMLMQNIEKNYDRSVVQATRVRPTMRKRLGRLSFNGDRFINRLWDYPSELKSVANDFDYFHLCDHSYSQLVHVLPRERTGVYCHDLNTFRCLLEPAAEPRPFWFRWMARHILRGLQKAAVVFVSTMETKRKIERLGLLPEAKIVLAPYGVAPEFKPSGPDLAADLIKPLAGRPFLLHVGSCVPRKRVDFLLEVFAECRKSNPQLSLVQVGGQWTKDQLKIIGQRGIQGSLLQLEGIDRPTLAAIYRRANLLLLPSEAEGFGLPMIEALSCGTKVIASDIPELREVGHQSARFCRVGDLQQWVSSVNETLVEPSHNLVYSQYSWSAYAKDIIDTYLEIDKGRWMRSPSATAIWKG